MKILKWRTRSASQKADYSSWHFYDMYQGLDILDNKIISEEGKIISLYLLESCSLCFNFLQRKILFRSQIISEKIFSSSWRISNVQSTMILLWYYHILRKSLWSYFHLVKSEKWGLTTKRVVTTCSVESKVEPSQVQVENQVSKAGEGEG